MKQGGNISGVVSLVMIFCVLCMTVFSVLTFATAQREHLLAVLTEKRAKEYYAAEAEADKIVSILEQGEKPDNVNFKTSGKKKTAEFSVPMEGNRVLEVSVLLDGEKIRVTKWKTAYAGDWTPDETITVWDGK